MSMSARAAQQDDAAYSTSENKWSKNGFGEPVPRSIGKFTAEESEDVRRAVQEYCAMKQISTARLCSECDHKAELKGAWMEIAKSLPHRTVQSVYRHGLRQLHPFKRGPWTEQECQSLLELSARMGKKWSAIQTKLNRSADACRDKYREMSNEYVRGRWKEPETECLKRLIREHLRVDPNADIKTLGKMVAEEGIQIPWTVISKKMNKRSRLSCFKKWQKLTGMAPYQKEGDKKVAAVTDVAAAAVDYASGDEDLYILSEVISNGVEKEIDWAIVVPAVANAEERWNALVSEWQVEDANSQDLLEKLTLAEVAQLLLERKQRTGDAKMAAETVEAVDLPPVPLATETREV